MKRKGIFSKREVFVILGCVVFALASLGAIGSSGRRRAKEAVCLSNLRQWGKVFSTAANDNNGYFMRRDEMRGWYMTLEPYYRNRNLLFCPEATKSMIKGARPPFAIWHDDWDDGEYAYAGSYCLNIWISNEQGSGKIGGDFQAFWRTPVVADADKVPMLGDGQWRDADPLDSDEPPLHEQDWWQPNANEMKRLCVNRHNGGVNAVFLDLSARKIGLKELWKLKWHREFDTNGPWTLAGGMTHQDWENWGDGWLATFKDY